MFKLFEASSSLVSELQIATRIELIDRVQFLLPKLL